MGNQAAYATKDHVALFLVTFRRPLSEGVDGSRSHEALPTFPPGAQVHTSDDEACALLLTSSSHPSQLRRPRATQEEFDGLLGEFMAAVQDTWGHVVVQFEDFGNTNAFRCGILNKVWGCACMARVQRVHMDLETHLTHSQTFG